MRLFEAAAFLALTARACAFTVPGSPSVDLLNVAGDVEQDHVSIRFNTSYPGATAGPVDDMEFTLKIPASHGECLGPNPLVNGVPLNQRWQADQARGRATLPIRSRNGDPREINISWMSVCVRDQGQVLSVHILQPVDHRLAQNAIGFTASFKQNGQPNILRLTNTPTTIGRKHQRLQAWLHPSEEQRLRIGNEANASPSALEAEFAKLADIKSEIAVMHALMRQQEKTIVHMLEKDFKKCEGFQCMVQTAMQKAPDFAHLIAQHFSHEKVKLSKNARFDETPLIETLEIPPPATEEVESMRENPAPPAPHPFDGEHRPHHPDGKDRPHPPFGGEHPPPFHGEHPHPPFNGDHRPPYHGEHPPPPPPDHEAPPPPHDGSQPPPPPPHHGHPPHGPPSFFGHIRHKRFGLLKAALALLAGSFLMSLLLKAICHHAPCFKDPRRRAERASRREERRARCEYRRAAHRHRISSWWAAHNPRRPSATNDYDEKRMLILQQEGVLEAVMQNEIRNLEVAAELEEGRGRTQVSPRHELEGQSSGSGRSMQQHNYSRSEYSAPPPRYEAELDDDMMVVDGFGYTPSNTDETPDSSVVDFSPRMSTETLLTNVTKSDRMD